MLLTIGWIIAVLSVGLQAMAVVRLGVLYRRHHTEENWQYQRTIVKWRHWASFFYAIAIINTVCFLIGNSMIGLIPTGLSLILMIPMAIWGGGEGEGAN
jgi:hypothetical protein